VARRLVAIPFLVAACLAVAAFALVESRSVRQPSPPPYPNPALASSIWKVPVSGGRRRLLLGGRGWQDSEPIVLPDGKTILFERPTSLSTVGLFMLRPGRHPLWLRNLPLFGRLGYSSGRGQFAWQRGQKIVAETIQGRPAGVLAHIRGSGWSVPVWSADGNTLAYAQTIRTPANPYQGEIVIKRRAGTRHFQLAGSAGPLAFSPSGDQLVFSWGRSLYILDTRTGERRLLANNAGSYAAWSPDGRTIAYGDPTGLVALDLPTNRRRLVYPKGAAPTFTPDSKHLIFITYKLPLPSG
jgi:Tol biopolymer transport system component